MLSQNLMKRLLFKYFTVLFKNEDLSATGHGSVSYTQPPPTIINIFLRKIFVTLITTFCYTQSFSTCGWAGAFCNRSCRNRRHVILSLNLPSSTKQHYMVSLHAFQISKYISFILVFYRGIILDTWLRCKDRLKNERKNPV